MQAVKQMIHMSEANDTRQGRLEAMRHNLEVAYSALNSTACSTHVGLTEAQKKADPEMRQLHHEVNDAISAVYALELKLKEMLE